MNNVNMDIFPEDIQEYLIPKPEGRMKYRCLSCEAEYGIEKLLYICPECKSVLLLHDENQERIKKIPGKTWRRILDNRLIGGVRNEK